MWKSVLTITCQFMLERPRMLTNIWYSPILWELAYVWFHLYIHFGISQPLIIQITCFYVHYICLCLFFKFDASVGRAKSKFTDFFSASGNTSEGWCWDFIERLPVVSKTEGNQQSLFRMIAAADMTSSCELDCDVPVAKFVSHEAAHGCERYIKK